jgi:multidrug efflux system membrane fusion protein
MTMRTLIPLLLAPLALALLGCDSNGASNGEPPATPVRVKAATLGPAAPDIHTSGVIANKDELNLSFKVGGVIKRIAVREGERVRKGQRLAEIEQVEIDAQVEQARQTYEQAQREVERGERLYADKVISLEQLEALRTRAQVAKAALDAAQFNRGYAVIVAPSDGTVLRKLANERELVAAGAPVILLGAMDRGFVVKAGVADREVVQLQLGDPAKIRLDALPNAELQGTVTEIASGADPASGMFGIEVAIEATDATLRSGLVAKLSIAPAASRNGTRVYVPLASIVEGDGDHASVYVLDGDRARRRAVQVAFIADDRVALESGVTEGELVVTDGALFLADGELVSVLPPDSDAPTAGIARIVP